MVFFKRRQQLLQRAVNDINVSTYKSHETWDSVCQKSRWDEAFRLGNAYVHELLSEQNGGFNQATAVAQRPLQTTNRFYQDTLGAWICLEICRVPLLQKLGFVTGFEEPKAVGDTATEITSRTNGVVRTFTEAFRLFSPQAFSRDRTP